MPIDTVAPGEEITDIKMNEIISAVNALQDGVGGPIVYGSGTANPLTLTLGFGRWIVMASGGFYESTMNSQVMQIDGVTVCTTPEAGDTDGVNLNPLGGVREILVTGESYEVDITLSGGSSTVIFLMAMAHRVV